MYLLLGDISENVLNLLDLAAAQNDFHYEDEEVEGKVHEVDAETEEDMIIYSCYIAECLTFRRSLDIGNKDIVLLRNKILDSILGLSYL
jgi:hypothetical protein